MYKKPKWAGYGGCGEGGGSGGTKVGVGAEVVHRALKSFKKRIRRNGFLQDWFERKSCSCNHAEEDGNTAKQLRRATTAEKKRNSIAS